MACRDPGFAGKRKLAHAAALTPFAKEVTDGAGRGIHHAVMITQVKHLPHYLGGNRLLTASERI
jgi:hypothetical protein